MSDEWDPVPHILPRHTALLVESCRVKWPRPAAAIWEMAARLECLEANHWGDGGWNGVFFDRIPPNLPVLTTLSLSLPANTYTPAIILDLAKAAPALQHVQFNILSPETDEFVVGAIYEAITSWEHLHYFDIRWVDVDRPFPGSPWCGYRMPPHSWESDRTDEDGDVIARPRSEPWYGLPAADMSNPPIHIWEEVEELAQRRHINFTWLVDPRFESLRHLRQEVLEAEEELERKRRKLEDAEREW